MKYFLYSFTFITILLVMSCSSSNVKSGDVDLTANKWEVVSIAGKTLSAEEIKSGIPFVSFGRDGAFTGNTGCNTFRGNYKLDKDKLSLDPGSMTQMFCIDSPEMNFLSAVQKTSGYKYVNNELILTDGSAELMKFVAKK